MRFVPVDLGPEHRTIAEPNERDPFELPPPAATVGLLELRLLEDPGPRATDVTREISPTTSKCTEMNYSIIRAETGPLPICGMGCRAGA